MSEEKRRIPIGYEDIKRVIDGGMYFVDKSLMIPELIDCPGQSVLFTRPRRFGKTLSMSMLRRFFEDEREKDGEKVDNSYIFKELAISKCGEKYLSHQQQYPVINLTLKGAKQPDFETAYEMLKQGIVHEFQRHRYVLSENMQEADREAFETILKGDGEKKIYANALQFLSKCLAAYHGKNAIILIDEYDVPLENAWFAGFYDEMIAFIRSLFESALKTNPYLERGVITGCLRISRESIFTGLNNLQIHSVLSNDFSTCFGFTTDDVKTLLAYYGIEEQYTELKDWYDGYLFGEAEIYNPWSIINYVDTKWRYPKEFPKPYWSNTSSNSIIKELIESADDATRSELEVLMDGGSIEKPVHEEITYGDIHSSQDNLWNFLFFTGYLKAGKKRHEGEDIFLTLEIPNREIKSIYRRSIIYWFDNKAKNIDKSPLIEALDAGDCAAAEDFITQQLMDTISYFDYAESYYHGFLTGLLKNNGKYLVSSNRESGLGRPDIILKEKKFRGKAMVLELKATENINEMETGCDSALSQIEGKNYDSQLAAEGYSPVIKYGICFFRKGCMVKTTYKQGKN